MTGVPPDTTNRGRRGEEDADSRVPQTVVVLLAAGAWLGTLAGLWTTVWGALRWAETTPFKGIPVHPNGTPIVSEGGSAFLCGAAGSFAALVLALLLTRFAWRRC